MELRSGGAKVRAKVRTEVGAELAGHTLWVREDYSPCCRGRWLQGVEHLSRPARTSRAGDPTACTAPGHQQALLSPWERGRLPSPRPPVL